MYTELYTSQPTIQIILRSLGWKKHVKNPPISLFLCLNNQKQYVEMAEQCDGSSVHVLKKPACGGADFPEKTKSQVQDWPSKA